LKLQRDIAAWCAVPLLIAAGGTALAQEHAGQYAQADIQYGARVYAAQCSSCHGPDGDQVAGVNLKSGQLRRAPTDDDLRRIVTQGIPGTSMPSRRLDGAESTGIIAYVRNMRDFDTKTVALGDPARGKVVFDDKGRCSSCHRVNGRGSRVAPDLSDIGSLRAAGAIQQSLINPTGSMMPINRPIRGVTKDGRQIRGRRLNEDTFTVQIMDDQEHLVSILKSDLREYTIGTFSPMPAYEDKLSAAEMADLTAYLVSLKGK
jgi:cytochrome c oxidase cbb3-type subunit III